MRAKGTRQVSTRRSKASEKPKAVAPAMTRSGTDIEAIWTQMKEKKDKEDNEEVQDMVAIKRTYEFAGEVKTYDVCRSH